MFISEFSDGTNFGLELFAMLIHWTIKYITKIDRLAMWDRDRLIGFEFLWYWDNLSNIECHAKSLERTVIQKKKSYYHSFCNRLLSRFMLKDFFPFTFVLHCNVFLKSMFFVVTRVRSLKTKCNGNLATRLKWRQNFFCHALKTLLILRPSDCSANVH